MLNLTCDLGAQRLVHHARFRKLLEIGMMLQKSEIYAQLLNSTCDLGAQLFASELREQDQSSPRLDLTRKSF